MNEKFGIELLAVTHIESFPSTTLSSLFSPFVLFLMLLFTRGLNIHTSSVEITLRLNHT